MKMVDDKRLRRIIRRYKKNSGELDAELEIPLTLSQIYKAIGIRKRDPFFVRPYRLGSKQLHMIIGS